MAGMYASNEERALEYALRAQRDHENDEDILKRAKAFKDFLNGKASE